MSEESVIAQVGDTLFGSGLEGAAAATEQAVELTIAEIIKDAGAVLDAAGTSAAQSALLDNARSLGEYNLINQIAVKYLDRAANATDPSQVELFQRIASEFSTRASQIESELVQSANSSGGVVVSDAASAAVKLFGPAITQTLAAVPGVLVSVYKIDSIIADGEQSGLTPDQIATSLSQEVISAGTIAAAAFTEAAKAFIAGAGGVAGLIARAGLVGIGLSAAFELGWLAGEKIAANEWFSTNVLPKFDPFFSFLDKFIIDPVSTFFTAAQRFVPRRDPLTLDLDNDGIETVGINATNPILFDHDGDGIKTATGWISPDDGFLVLDRDDNGTIDSGLELFGDATPLSGGGTAEDGFAALADQDSNLDGRVDANDANFQNLRIWQDLNQDGISQANELSTLTDKGIAAINVGNVNHSQTLPNGNQIGDLGTYVKTDGSTGTVGQTSTLADVNLADDTFHRQFTDTLPLTPEIQALPNMQGSGAVRDLREAASQSALLQSLLTQYANATTRAAQLSLIDQLLDAWADTSGMVESLDERNPSNFVIRHAPIMQEWRAAA